MVFLSELNMFSHDVPQLMTHISPKYNFSVNSEDKHDTEASFNKNKTHGGTMILWKKDLEPYISIFPTSTSSFLPLVYSPPGSPTTVHIALYLPTSGQEAEFVDQITELKNKIEEILTIHPGSIVFLRGDSNVNPNNRQRSRIFANFCEELKLKNIPTNHKTYHHFVGQGAFDSSIDVILHSNSAPNQEEITKVLCQNIYPEIDSLHDAIVSRVSLPCEPLPDQQILLLPAPKIVHNRHRICCNDDKFPDYQDKVVTHLERIRKEWLIPTSSLSVSVLLDTTNQILSQAARDTNYHVPLMIAPKPKYLKPSKDLQEARRNLRAAHKVLKKSKSNYGDNLVEKETVFKKARQVYRHLCRVEIHKDDLKRDSELFSVFSSSSPPIFKSIRALKSSAAASVPFLTIGEKNGEYQKTYPADMVGDGLYHSIAELKTQDKTKLVASSKYSEWAQDFKYILAISEQQCDIPPISVEMSTKILKRMKPHVIDFWSITPSHFLYAGEQGAVHFNFLMNRIILEINTASVKELNTVLALLLYKGHGKPKTSARSYRTISTCPVLAKALDMYVHDLFIDLWNEAQAKTQYQGQGSSHDLASLLITETVQASLFTSNQFIYLLFLDAKSAFVTVVIEFLIRNLYLTGQTGNSLHYLKNRLANRITYCTWNRSTMGPIVDEHGLEQGGNNSSDLYKVYNNELLEKVQKSKLGVPLGEGLVVSCVGQADDVCLLSNDLYSLHNLLQLTLNYCQQFHIQLCADKTKLLKISHASDTSLTFFNPLAIYDQKIEFSDQAEHVGVIRSPSGNLPHLLGRICAHKKSKAALLSSGVARRHRGNIAAALRVHTIYSLPVLLSGIPSLLLSSYEMNIIDSQHRCTLSSLLKLYPTTTHAFTYFMAGSLPAKAIVHQRQLSLFSMICHLPEDPLHVRAKYALTCLPPSHRSWFKQVRDICCLYDLPHPVQLLTDPVSKESFKKLVRSKVVSFWELKLRQETLSLSSLVFFKPAYHSLTKPHPMLWTPGPNPFEVSKALVQCKMLSGRYRTEALASHWSQNKLGYCLNKTCSEVSEDLQHILIECPSYQASRDSVMQLWLQCTHPLLLPILVSILEGSPFDLLQFILDASVHPEIITLKQNYGDVILKIVFHLTRTWCFVLHKERAKVLGHWPK